MAGSRSSLSKRLLRAVLVGTTPLRTPIASVAIGVVAVTGAVGLAVHAGPARPTEISSRTAPVDAGIAAMLASYRRPASVPELPAPAQVALGKQLFFDPRLSGSGAISCASCHDPAHAWQDGLPRGIGHHGTVLPRRTPTIIDTAWAEPLFWDGRADTLEEQALGPITGPGEMNMPPARATAALRRIPGYRAGFATAFPGKQIDMTTITAAIAAYERTLVSGTAPFDRWVAGDRDALSTSARRGFVLFNTKGRCATCHSSWRFTDDGFHDIGLPGTDKGRGAIVPNLPILDHAFKTPTLRNVADRPPYMHDGALKTLAAVIDHYDRPPPGRPSLAPDIVRLNLTATEKADLVAFLQSLSSRDAPVSPPILPPSKE